MLHRQKINAEGAYLQLPLHAIAIPVEYKEQAYNMFVRGSNIDPLYVQKMDVKVVATPHLEDPLDWFYFTNPSLHPVIEVGFLNGKEQPEVKIETSPNGKAFYDDRMRIDVTYYYSVSIIGYLGCGKVDGAAP
jgi:hypothetical protein